MAEAYGTRRGRPRRQPGAHGPVLGGPFVAAAFDQVRDMAVPVHRPATPELLDELVAHVLAGVTPTA